MMMNKPSTKLANFGMALPYFPEAVELQEGISVSGSPVTYGEIGQMFGNQTIIVFGQTIDGQIWRLIYPDETTACWVEPCRATPSVQLITYQE
jgi:hypothetical protein